MGFSHCNYYHFGGKGLGGEGGARMPPNTTPTLRYEEYPVGCSSTLMKRHDFAAILRSLGNGWLKRLTAGIERRKLSG
jgi:hypothetical protein